MSVSFDRRPKKGRVSVRVPKSTWVRSAVGLVHQTARTCSGRTTFAAQRRRSASNHKAVFQSITTLSITTDKPHHWRKAHLNWLTGLCFTVTSASYGARKVIGLLSFIKNFFCAVHN